MAIVAGYGRTSGEDQERSETIETQRKLLMAWAQKEGHDLLWYGDDGVMSSVLVGDREEGGRLLRDAARKRFEFVVCYKLSRWSRIPEVWHEGRDRLRSHGIDLVCLHDDTSDKTPSQRFSLNMRLLVNEYERDNIESQCLDGRYSWASEGYYPGGIVPYGFQVIDDPARRSGKKARGVLALDPDEARVIEMIYRWCVEDRLSSPKIAARLSSLGIPRPTAGRDADRHRVQASQSDLWHASTVKDLLSNPRYKGEPAFGKRSKKGREQTACTCPAIVDSAIWDAAQEQLKANRNGTPREGRRVYLLRGLVHCVKCNRTLVGSLKRSGRKTFIYYYCPGGRKRPEGHGFCPLPYLPALDLEGHLWEVLVPLVRDREGTVRRLREGRVQGERRSVALQASCDGLRGAIEKKRVQLGRALALHTDEKISWEEYSGLRTTVQEEIDRLAAELERQHRELVGLRGEEARIGDVAAWLSRWQEDVENPTPEGQRRVVEQLVKQVTVAKGEYGLEIEYILCLDPRSGVPFVDAARSSCVYERNSFLLTVAGALLRSGRGLSRSA